MEDVSRQRLLVISNQCTNDPNNWSMIILPHILSFEPTNALHSQKVNKNNSDPVRLNTESAILLEMGQYQIYPCIGSAPRFLSPYTVSYCFI